MLRAATERTRTSTAGSNSTHGQAFRQQGFSLLELVIALVVVSLMLALVVPSLTSALEQAKLKATARTLAATLRMAREQAIARQVDAVVLVNVGARRYGLEGSGRVRTIPEGIRVKVFAARAEQQHRSTLGIRYFPDGTATGGRVSLAQGLRHYDVDVDWLTGRVQIED